MVIRSLQKIMMHFQHHKTIIPVYIKLIHSELRVKSQYKYSDHKGYLNCSSRSDSCK